MRFSTRQRLVACSSVLLAASAFVVTGLRAQPKPHPVLRGAAFLWEPYEFRQDRTSSGAITGFDVELTREILAPAGFDADFLEMPDRAQQLAAVRNGDADFTTSPRLAGERDAYFSDPIRREISVLYMRRGDGVPSRFGTVADLARFFRRRGIRLGLVRGFTYGTSDFSTLITQERNSGNVRDFDNPDQLIHALTETRSIDAFVIDRIAGETIAHHHGNDQLLDDVTLPAECSVDICLMFSRKTVPAALVTRVNENIARLKKGIRYGQLVRFYALPVLLSITVGKPWFFAMDLIGTLAFAIGGTLVARREHFGLIGAFVLAALPTVGGGLVRDLIVQRHPVFLLRSPAYMIIIISVVFVGFVASRVFDFWRERRASDRGDLVERGKTVERLLQSRGGYALEVCDAIGLSAFLIVGVIVAVETRAVPLLLWGPALATLTGCGGGILRDVVRADAGNPLLKTTFYGEVALIWGLIFSLFLRWETWRLDEIEVQIGVLVIFFGALATRMAAVHLRARSPSF